MAARSDPSDAGLRIEGAAMAPARGEPMLSDAAVGRAIRRLRRGQGTTLKQLGARVGVTGAQLHRYETGETRIAASRLIAIADGLGVPAAVLIAAGSTMVIGLPPAISLPPPAAQGDDDIVELIHVFGTITSPRDRRALVSVARMMASHYQRVAGPGEA